jgi:hypothetical protein
MSQSIQSRAHRLLRWVCMRLHDSDCLTTVRTRTHTHISTGPGRLSPVALGVHAPAPVQLSVQPVQLRVRV